MGYNGGMSAKAKKKNGAARAKKQSRAASGVEDRLDRLEALIVANAELWREMLQEEKQQRLEMAAEQKQRWAEYDKQRAEAAAEQKRQQKEMAAEQKRQQKEMAAEQKQRWAEYDKQSAKQRAEYDKQRAKQRAEYDKRHDAYMAEMKELQVENRREIGGVINANGDIFEHDCAEAVGDAMELNGVHLDFVVPNVYRGVYEFDLVGVNKKSALLIEAKQTLRAADVLRFADVQLPEFKRLCPEYAKGRKVTGALMFRRAPLENRGKIDPVAIALKKKLLVVQVFGKSRMQIITSTEDVKRKKADR